jgi:hypothetical protein
MTANSRIRAWLREHGEHVSDRGRLSAAQLEIYYSEHEDQRPAGPVRLLPGPDDDLDAWEDLGVIGPDSDPEPPDAGLGAEMPPDEREGVSVDPEPAHARRDWRRGGGQKTSGGPRAKPTRVTAGVRGDINAKISFALEIPGRIWQARDPACGGTFVEQRPQISDALTEIVCQSPDLIAWFAGSGGQFMLWMNLAAACWPVATVIMAHHVYHTLEELPADAQQPDYGQYAA